MADDMNATDWVSAISSLAAAIIGIVTLLTVYIGAMQLLSQNRMYRLGLSWRSLGIWKDTVAKSALFGLQRRISSPTVSLKFLIKKQWKPNLNFPVGFPRDENTCVEEAESLVLANASWVNFMQALGLSPDNGHFYELQDASELVNGIVPMHWTGKDLVCIASMLSFQSYEDSPSYKSPMPLPMQWSGPLGWLQFRSSTNGCVAEFRPRMPLYSQISKDLHCHYDRKRPELPLKPYALKSRLWNSINGFVLENDQVLYLGGADRSKRPQEVDDDPEIKPEDLLDDLMTRDHSDEDVKRMLFGKKDKQPKALRREVERNGPGLTQRPSGRADDDVPDFLKTLLHDKICTHKMKEVLRPCPGLLSVTVEGELAYARGLSVTNCIREYDREYTDDVDHKKYPHNLGDLYMDLDLLKLMKEALILLRPDGFYFSPAAYLYGDLSEVYHDIEEQSNVLMEIFPKGFIPASTADAKPNGSGASGTSSTISFRGPEHENRECLRVAMMLCNELQATRKTARACFSVADMRLLAKAVSVLRDGFLTPNTGNQNKGSLDLIWAMLSCDKLSRSILKAVKTAPVAEFLTTKVTCKAEMLDCEALGQVAAKGGEKIESEDWKFSVPLVADGEFTGEQVVAALAVTFITYYWIDKKWITDVAVYNNTIPQSVLMC